MRSFFNENFLIEPIIIDKKFKNSILCPLCHNIFFEPIICMKCKNTYCKQCISKLNDNCPNKCNNTHFEENSLKKKILKHLIFKCINIANRFQSLEIKQIGREVKLKINEIKYFSFSN